MSTTTSADFDELAITQNDIGPVFGVPWCGGVASPYSPPWRVAVGGRRAQGRGQPAGTAGPRAARIPRPEPPPPGHARRAGGGTVAGARAARPGRDSQHAAVEPPARSGRGPPPRPLRAAARAA